MKVIPLPKEIRYKEIYEPNQSILDAIEACIDLKKRINELDKDQQIVLEDDLNYLITQYHLGKRKIKELA